MPLSKRALLVFAALSTAACSDDDQADAARLSATVTFTATGSTDEVFVATGHLRDHSLWQFARPDPTADVPLDKTAEHLTLRAHVDHDDQDLSTTQVTISVLDGHQKRTEIVCPRRNGTGNTEKRVAVSGGEYRIRLLYDGVWCGPEI